MSKPKTQKIPAYPAALKGAPSPSLPVPGTEPWIAAIVQKAKTFGATEAASAEIDNDWLRAKNLIGVTLCIIAVDMAYKQFGNSDPKMTATYSFYIVARPELGLRKMDLQSKLAIAQARALVDNQQDFPFLACVELDDPSKGQFASAVLHDARPESVWYVHTPWGEKPGVAPTAPGAESETVDSPF